jgi:ornithine carbamoyltransferase
MTKPATSSGQKIDFISIADTPQPLLDRMMSAAARLKKQLKETGKNDPIASGKSLAMIFEKPSLRTRVSFEVAMNQIGGHAIYISPTEIGLGTRESVPDVARVLAGFCDAIMGRVFEHQKLIDLAQHASVPVINGLSDYSHPCQALADLMTMQEHFGNLKGRTLAYIGDGNNVARSLMVACGRFGVKFRIAAPPGYELEETLIERVLRQIPSLDYAKTNDPFVAVEGADVIYTDTWVSMGQEAEKERRLPVFMPYQINAKLLAAAPKQAMVMHCLPAYRGVEITDEVIDGPQSLVFPEAENRLHFQKGLMAVVLGAA